MAERFYIKSYSCSPTAPCYCGSNIAFGDCCASTSDNRHTPSGIFILNNYVASKECKRIIRFCEKQKREWLTTYQTDKQGKTIRARDKARVTQSIYLNNRQQTEINELVSTAFIKEVEPRIKNMIESLEVPHILRYRAGGYYLKHADSEVLEKETNRWYRNANRDVSLLIYLNDEYSGGDLYFPNLNFTYYPKQGDCVFFPSTHIYVHESQRIEKGTKYAIVSWASIKGSPRIKEDVGPLRIVFR